MTRALAPFGHGVAAARVLARTGWLRPMRPDRAAGLALSMVRWGMSPAAGFAAGAARDPCQLAVIDDRESLTYADVHRRSTAVAHALADRGVRVGDAVALLARNSSAFLIAQAAISKLGADVLYLNTGFAAPQLGEVLAGEATSAIVVDEEFVPLLNEVAPQLPRLVAWSDNVDTSTDDSFAALAEGELPELKPPGRESKHVILTSGTTGRPKGAPRSAPGLLSGLTQMVSFLDAIPYRGRGVTVLAAPAFHAWGLGNLILGVGLQSTFVMSRRFDPVQTLELVARHRADTLVAVPVMVQRILELPASERHAHDVSSLRIVALSGSALPPSLALSFMDEFGDVLYSLYGSTEVAYVSVAGPGDFRTAPASAGRVLRGVSVRIVDQAGRDVAAGQSGRIFAGGPMAFEGYTGGDDKERLGALTSTGDIGRMDGGRLYVEGRDDDMIVSGGENVFPAEVEDCLHQHPDVADVAVVGVNDDRFGQALVAHVVLREGRSASPDDLRAFVKSRLATYKVPREVALRDSLPRNASGKVLKRDL